MRKLNKKTKNLISAYFYGGCTHNPGGIAMFSGVIFNNNDKIWKFSEKLYPDKSNGIITSNHVADYCGFLTVLKYLFENSYHKEKIEIFTESNLIESQMDRSVYSYGVNKGYYVNYALEAYNLFKKFKKSKIKGISREKNRNILSTSNGKYVYTGILNDNLNNLIF